MILGPSGAGKSTLPNLLGGLDNSTLSSRELADYLAAVAGFVVLRKHIHFSCCSLLFHTLLTFLSILIPCLYQAAEGRKAPRRLPSFCAVFRINQMKREAAVFMRFSAASSLYVGLRSSSAPKAAYETERLLQGAPVSPFGLTVLENENKILDIAFYKTDPFRPPKLQLHATLPIIGLSPVTGSVFTVSL